MKNAIKYILDKRNMMQRELAVGNFDEKYVSKVVNGKFRIHWLLVEPWENILNVPRHFFIDKDTGLCKQLNSIDLHELERYLDIQHFVKNEEELQKFPEVEFSLREHALSASITKLQRNIRKDILSVQDVTSNIEALDTQECNLGFYTSVLDAHKSNHLNYDEWRSLFRAFQYVVEDIDEDIVDNDNALVYGMYILLKKARELNAAKLESNRQMYTQLFGSLTNKLAGDNE